MNASLAMANISVDRSVWYHVEDIDFDYSRVAEYYETLPFTNKPPLEDCKIHISAMGCLDRVGSSLSNQQLARNPRQPPTSRFQKKHVLIDGVHFLERRDAHLLDPLAPSADVLLFLGTSTYEYDYSRIVLSLGQQLAAYAMGKDAYPAMSETEEQLRSELEKRERAALRNVHRGRAIDMAANSVAAGLGAALIGAVDFISGGGQLAMYGGTVAYDAVSEAVEAMWEGAQDQRRRLKVGRKVLDHALAREATIEVRPVKRILEHDAMRFSPRRGKHLRSPIVIWSRPRLSINHLNHVKRSLRRLPLTRSENSEGE